MRCRGFTLLEVLVAVSITALLGVGAAQVLSGLINVKEATEAKSSQLAALQRMNNRLARDIRQFINRPIRDAYGDSIDALRLDDGGDYYFEFTRAGWRNRPGVEDTRSELQRVAYATVDIDDDACEYARRSLAETATEEDPEWEFPCLVRYSWDVLDRDYNSEVRSAVVLNQVASFYVSVLAEERDDEGNVASTNWYSEWPIVQTEGAEVLPVAVKVEFEIPGMGEIERLWPIAHDGDL